MKQKYNDKHIYLAYREAAQRLVQEPVKAHVAEHAPVHQVEGGAYVEAMIWVPAEALERTDV